jgi:SAM-dependent methyltransferase
MEYVSSIKSNYPDYFKNKKVLEVGSLDINGSVRIFFDECEYTGIDVGEGNGVDVVCEGQTFQGETNFYDVVISCECFEHNPYWIETFENMYRMCKPAGLIVMTCATTGRNEHGTTKRAPHKSPLTVVRGWDYYKNLTEEDFRKNIDFDDIFSEYKFSDNKISSDLYFFGIAADPKLLLKEKTHA